MEERAKQIAALLKMLANEHRLLILCALIRGPLTVGEIHAFVPNLTGPALSQHLGHLKMAGILDSEKHGMNVIYKMDDSRIALLMEAVKKIYCSD